MTTIQDIITRWDSGEGKPYKGSLIDWNAYGGDGTTAPPDIGCMCAQGQVLHLLGGWSPQRLHDIEQAEADEATAKLLNISVAHSILLRSINDKINGAPSIVLTHPEKVLGDQAHIVLAFWRHMDRMTSVQWDAARDAARDATGAATGAAARAAARDAARDATGAATGAAAWDAAWAAAWDAAWDAARDAAWDAAWACAEIQGARVMCKKNQAFFFLPLFGFADPEAVLAAERSAG